MLAHKLTTYPSMVNLCREIVTEYCNKHKIPVPPVLPDDGKMEPDSRAAFDIKKGIIFISPSLLTYIEGHPPVAKVWAIHSVARHELRHYEEWLMGKRKASQFDEGVSYPIARTWADSKIKGMSKEEINPFLPAVAAGLAAGIGFGAGSTISRTIIKKRMKNPFEASKLAVVRIGGFYKDLDSGEKDFLSSRDVVRLLHKRGSSWVVDAGPGVNTMLVPASKLTFFKNVEFSESKYKPGDIWRSMKNPGKQFHVGRIKSLHKHPATEYYRGRKDEAVHSTAMSTVSGIPNPKKIVPTRIIDVGGQYDSFTRGFSTASPATDRLKSLGFKAELTQGEDVRLGGRLMSKGIYRIKTDAPDDVVKDALGFQFTPEGKQITLDRLLGKSKKNPKRRNPRKSTADELVGNALGLLGMIGVVAYGIFILRQIRRQ